MVRLDDPLPRKLDARWAVVLDANGDLHGWISGEHARVGTGTVREHAHRMEAWLPVGASLKQAFSTMLQHDAGWIAVIDKDSAGRFLGVRPARTRHCAARRPRTRGTSRARTSSWRPWNTAAGGR